MQLRTDATTVVLLLSVAIIAVNWFGVLRWWMFKRHFSAIPLIGGALGVWGILMAPQTHAFGPIKSLFWLPLILDYGSIPLFVFAIFGADRKRNRQEERKPTEK